MKRTLAYFLDTQQPDGGWRCEKYSYGHGEETRYSTPYTTLVVLDLFRQVPSFEDDARWTGPRRSCCRTGTSAGPSARATTASVRVFAGRISHAGVWAILLCICAFLYARARRMHVFAPPLTPSAPRPSTGACPWSGWVPRLSALSFCKKGQVSWAATARWREILHNFEKDGPDSAKSGPETLANRQGCDILPPITHLCRPCDCAARARWPHRANARGGKNKEGKPKWQLSP